MKSWEPCISRGIFLRPFDLKQPKKLSGEERINFIRVFFVTDMNSEYQCLAAYPIQVHNKGVLKSKSNVLLWI